MATQLERRAATRARVVEAAHRLFVDRGYDQTTTAMIVDAAGVSRGAMYHHFGSKEDVFAVVFEQVAVDAISASTACIRDHGSPREALLAGCLAWLDQVRRPEVAAILLDQGPAVLGWSRCRDIDNSHSLRLMVGSLRAAVAAGEIETSSPELTARVINAALSEIALALVHQPGRGVTVSAARASVRTLVEGLGSGAGTGRGTRASSQGSTKM